MCTIYGVYMYSMYSIWCIYVQYVQYMQYICTVCTVYAVYMFSMYSICSIYVQYVQYMQYICSVCIVYAVLFAVYMYSTVGVKKVTIYRPYNGTGNTVPFPFHSRLISVRLPFLSVFKPFPFCPKGSSSILVNGPNGVIKHAQSLIAQEGSRQFSDRDRARASAT